MASGTLSAVRKKKLAFYLSIIILPMIQFVIFYIVVNANTFVLALQDYEYTDSGELVSKFVWFDNIGAVLKDMFTKPVFLHAIRNSFVAYLIGLVFSTVLSLLFSYYIFKKCPFANGFKVLLYLPNIVSVMVLSVMYNFLLNRGIADVFNRANPGMEMLGLLKDPNTRFGAVMFFCVLVSFGSNVLIYSGSMSGISPSILEAGEVDGVNGAQEFFLIVLPQVYPMLVTFLVAQLATIFTNQINLFNLYGLEAEYDVYTFGYYMYREITYNLNDLTKYPYLSALGLLLTAIAVPVTLGARALLNKYGPSED